MAQVFGLKELQDRKRALVAESEVYRQMLQLEVQNIRLYRVRFQRKFALMRLANPLFLLAGSLLGSKFLGRKPRLRRRGRWSLLGISLMAWRIFKIYGPLVQGLAARYLPRRGADRGPSEVPSSNM